MVTAATGVGSVEGTATTGSARGSASSMAKSGALSGRSGIRGFSGIVQMAVGFVGLFFVEILSAFFDLGREGWVV